MKFNIGESITDCGNDVSHLQLLFGKGRAGKPHVLDTVITALKENDNFVDEIFLVMDPTGKAASNMCGPTLHSNKEGLSIPTKKGLQEIRRKKIGVNHQ